jgi:sigma-B regulation protein RsbU (phosphoserine phosphatase)
MVNPSKRKLAVAIILVAFCGLLGLQASSLYQFTHTPRVGFLQKNFLVARVFENSPAQKAGLKTGDTILEIDGVPVDDVPGIARVMRGARPGDVMSYSVARGDQAISVSILTEPRTIDEILRVVLRMIVGLAFLVVGLAVSLKRTDRLGIVFFFLCCSFTTILTMRPGVDLSWAEHALYDAAVLALAPLFLDFFLNFPERKPLLTRRPRLQAYLYLPSAVLLAVTEGFNFGIYRRGMGIGEGIELFQNISSLYFTLCILLGIISFVHSYRTISSPRNRRRLHLVLWGTVAGILPTAIVSIVVTIWPNASVPALRYVFLTMIFMPLAFGHAILRYGLMDVEIVIKRGTVYALLTGLLVALYFAVVEGIGRAVGLASERASFALSLLSIFLMAVVFSPARNRIQAAVDKAFYRRKYRYREALREFSHALASVIDLDMLLRMLVGRISQNIHIHKVAVLLRDESNGGYAVKASVGISEHRRQMSYLKADDVVIKWLEEKGEALQIDRMRTEASFSPLSEDEVSRLAAMGASLLVPLVVKGNLNGVLVLSPKLSGDFYTSEDRDLLGALADQAAVAIENARLHCQALEKQKLEEELAVARRIQANMLPAEAPELEGWEVAGKNIQCKEVGGDYFDYFKTGENTVAIAIGDASGKGVPAALLMASIQSHLRVQAERESAPAVVLKKTNRWLVETTDPECFVSLFLGILDTDSSTLTYSNAGHNPPLLVRSSGAIGLLEEGGTVLGMLEGDYGQGEVNLEPGDTIVLYTDGVVEERDSQGDMFGLERLVKMAMNSRRLDAKSLVETIIDEVSDFAEGDREDDTTVSVIRFKAPSRSPLTQWSNVE